MKIKFYLYCFSIFVVCTDASEALPGESASADDGVDPRGLFYEKETSEVASASKSSSTLLNVDDSYYPTYITPTYRPYPIPFVPSYPVDYTQSYFPSYLPSYYYPGTGYSNYNIAQSQGSSATASSTKNQFDNYINTGSGGYYPYFGDGSSSLSSASQSASSNYEDNFSKLISNSKNYFPSYPYRYPYSYPSWYSNRQFVK